jgi:adenosylcobinamide-phosphate synthase
MIPSSIALAGALAVDWYIGEPPAALHPVVWMGWVARRLENALFRSGPVGQLMSGALVALGIPAGFAAGAAWLGACLASHPVVSAIATVWLLKSTFALRALGRAGLDVAEALDRRDLGAARVGLRSLCSRDPSLLDSPALVAASVESLAENTCDSVVAPLFYLALFGLPGAVFYRAVNTLDAMIGYHGRYEYFGRPAARLDDLLNLIPARATAVLMLVAGKLVGRDVRRGAVTMMRDHAQTESPNAGWPMAAMAGLLGVELTKDGAYRLGEAVNILGAKTIHLAWRVSAGAGLLAFSLAAAFLLLRRHMHGV